MTTVRLPDAFRRYAGGSERVEVAPGTAAGALSSVVDAHPDLGSRLFDAAGTLRPHLSVAVGDRVVPPSMLGSTPVGPEDEVVVLIGLAGG